MIHLSDNSLKILNDRYLKRDTNGNITENVVQLFKRVANAVAIAELQWGDIKDVKKWMGKYYKMMSELLFLPNSPTLMNAGTYTNQLSACFVLPVNDNLKSIFNTLKNAALIQQSGGGTGFNFSHLRPKGDVVNKTGGTASGPVSFMKIFNSATEYVKQGGRRRGANMGILNIDHPDIEEFIAVKKEEGVLQNFNISIGMSDKFMKALELNAGWKLKHPNTHKIVKTVPAKKIWAQILHSAWQTGDPGLIFLDAVNRSNPTPAFGKIESTNPCGEVPLLPYEACNLGSINLSKFFRLTQSSKEINWQKLEDTITTAIRFLDDVIDVNNYIIPEIEAMAKANRKIGLGVMGWAELLIQMEIPYESEQAVQLAEQVMKFIRDKSTAASKLLAKERGCFPAWEKSIYYPGLPLRNATTTSIAPTGTISIIADTSSSIEPLFAVAFQRKNILNNSILNSVNPFFIKYIKSNKLFSRQLFKYILQKGDVAKYTMLPQPVKKLFKTATEITPEWHLKHQAAFQKFTDNAVSKTINLPESASKKLVDRIYKSAWRQNLKGITVFRYNSKSKQVMHKGTAVFPKSCNVCKI